MNISPNNTRAFYSFDVRVYVKGFSKRLENLFTYRKAVKMTVDFFKNYSDKRYVNKSISLVNELVDVVLLDNNVNVSSPHFRVSGVNFTEVNYCYVAEFKRYYYITASEVLHGNMVDISCDVDVLMSFKSDILNSAGIIERSTKSGNVLIADSNFNVNRVDETLTNLAFSGCEFSSTNITNASNNFLLVTFGGKTREV